MRDRTNIILIGFIVIFAMSAALLATGIIPTVIDTVNVANETRHESINQTAILQDFVTLYLANTLNDTKENTKALSAARESIANQEESLRNQENTLLNQENLLNENRNITNDILQISKEHKSVEHDHVTLQQKSDDLIEKIDNITQLNFELLERHAANVSKTEAAEMNLNK